MTPNEHLDREALITAIDAALDWADANARAFPIETAPSDGWFLAWDLYDKTWNEMTASLVAEYEIGRFTDWTPLPPPPSNPPLPAPLEALGEVLRRVKGV